MRQSNSGAKRCLLVYNSVIEQGMSGILVYRMGGKQMRTITTATTVTPTGEIIVAAPPDIAPGMRLNVVLVIEEATLSTDRPPFPVITEGTWVELPTRREELYDDRSR